MPWPVLFCLSCFFCFFGFPFLFSLTRLFFLFGFLLCFQLSAQNYILLLGIPQFLL